MIGHVSPLGVSTTQPLLDLTPLRGADGTRNASDASAIGPAPLGAAGLSEALSVLQVNAQVAELLQGVGQGLENNKTLQLLIALMILVTLLQGGGQSKSAGEALNGLGAQGGGREAYLSMTTTSISIEQTSMTFTATGVESFNAAGAEQDSSGRKIDVSA